MNEQTNICKKGSGRKPLSRNKKDKYILEYENKKYICKTYQDIADITKRSKMCIYRIVTGKTTYRCKERTKDLKKIKITKIK